MKVNQLNYLSLKELDTLKQQGYDLASVQKGIALALGAKSTEQVCALLKTNSKIGTVLKETEKENDMKVSAEKESQKFNVGDVVVTKDSFYGSMFLDDKEYTVQPYPVGCEKDARKEFWLRDEDGDLIYFTYGAQDSNWELVRKADEVILPSPSGEGYIKVRGLGAPKDKRSKLDANILEMSDLQYLQTLVKGQLYDLECEIDTAKGFIVAIKELWEDHEVKRESLKYQRFYLRDLRKQRNKIAKLQTKLKRIKV